MVSLSLIVSYKNYKNTLTSLLPHSHHGWCKPLLATNSRETSATILDDFHRWSPPRTRRLAPTNNSDYHHQQHSHLPLVNQPSTNTNDQLYDHYRQPTLASTMDHKLCGHLQQTTMAAMFATNLVSTINETLTTNFGNPLVATNSNNVHLRWLALAASYINYLQQPTPNH